MSKPDQNIRALIRENKIEEAVEHLNSMDSDMCVLLQRELSERQRFYLLGTISLEEVSLHRSNVSHRVLSYLKLYVHATHSLREPTHLINPNPINPEDSAPQIFILPIEKTLIQQHLDMEKPVYLSSPKIMTFYFLERKETAIEDALKRLEKFRQDGRQAFTELLSTLRVSANELKELHDVLQTAGFSKDKLTLTTMTCSELCDKLRKEVSPSALKNATIRTEMEQVEILLSRICRQIMVIKQCADRFSES